MIDAAELPFANADYVEMWNRVAAEWRERNRFRHVRDYGRSRSTVLTDADLQRHLRYLDGAPEMQRDAIDAFKARQAERHAGMAPEDYQKLSTGVVTAHRDAAAAKVCGKLLRHGLDEHFVAGLLSAWNVAYCRPPISEPELRAIFHRILDADTRRLEAAAHA